jgi:hypothetical protein
MFVNWASVQWTNSLDFSGWKYEIELCVLFETYILQHVLQFPSRLRRARLVRI